MSKPFRWGSFSQLVDAGIVDDSQLQQDKNGWFECTSKRLNVDEGEGHLLYVNTPDMRVLVADCTFQQERRYEICDDGLVRFHFGFDVSIETWIGREARPELTDNAAGVLLAGADDRIRERVPAEQRQTFVTIACRPDWIEGFFGIRLRDQLPEGDEEWMHYPLAFTPTLRNTTQAILGRGYTSMLDAAFVTTKAQDIILSAIDGVAQTRKAAAQRLSQADIAAVRTAHMILEGCYKDPPDIQTLSRRVGVNRTKLFYGFKRLYGVSVAQFIDSLRMNEARRLLLDTDLSVSQIAAEVGYGYAASFSTRFKGHFGHPPRALRTRHSATE
ncbi:helix-turn-helix domain-containing protein [Rhizobium sp. SGZ-381]|uniref:helix-turn-helix domain-containing protein n=1 Tax=Rhizobium sp. SGZ-381 TaxID=3342800 RepID=UPI00366B7796